MIELFKKLKFPIIVLGILIVLFVIYSRYYKGDGQPKDKIQSSINDNSVPQEEQQFLNLLLKIQNISLDTQIFQDPLFTSLQDDGLAIIDQPKGRRNPFAPLGLGNDGNDLPSGTTTSAKNI